MKYLNSSSLDSNTIPFFKRGDVSAICENLNSCEASQNKETRDAIDETWLKTTGE